MKYFIVVIILQIILYGCAAHKKINGAREGHSSYLITKIDSINSWYTIYATKKDSVYKIIVKKDGLGNPNCKKIIQVGISYQLNIFPINHQPPVINGIKVQPMNYLDIHSYGYDESTSIGIEPEKGIYILHHTPDIAGLCYIRTAK